LKYRKQVDLQSLQSKKYFFVAGRLERPVGATNQDGFGVGARLNWVLEPEVFNVRQPRKVEANEIELPAVSG